MAISDAQQIGAWFFGEDAELLLSPETPGSIDLNALKVDLTNWDGTVLIKTLTPGSGITVGALDATAKWATDELDVSSRPKFPPGRYQCQVWTTTPGSRHVVGQGPFEVQTRDS